jgi:hypothetical protein
MGKNMILNWVAYDTYCYKLLQKVKQSGIKYDSIIAIMRGGYSIGLYLSNFLKIPLLAIQAQNHKYNEPERGEKGNTIVLGEIYGFGNVGKNVLLVDDICDSGDTISRVTNYLKEKKIVVDAAVMVMRFNYSSVKYWSLIIENNDWVVFPYEPSPEEVL